MPTPDEFLFDEPTLPRYAHKEELCPKGDFASAPLAMFRRRGVPLAAKCVYMMLLDYLRPGRGVWVGPSVRKIMRMLAMGRRQVKSWISWLHEHGYIERRQQPGHSNLVAFAHPDDWPGESASFDELDQVCETRAEIRTTTRAEIRTTTVRESARPPVRESAPLPTPELTRVNGDSGLGLSPDGGAGGVVRNSALPYNQDSNNTPNQSDGAVCVVNVDAETLRSDIGEAYRNIFGSNMPATWEERIDQECARGNIGLVAQIDEKTIRAGRAYAKKVERTFGIGWVLHLITNRQATDLDQQRRLQASGRAKRHAADRHNEDLGRHRAQQAERREYFDSLKASTRERYIKEAAATSKVQRPGVLGAMAIELAWRAHEAQIIQGISEYQDPGQPQAMT